MTAWFALLILATVIGGISLWLSGLLFGRRSGKKGPGQEVFNALAASQAALHQELDRVKRALIEVRAERGQLSSDLENASSTLGRAESELGLMREELVQLRSASQRDSQPAPYSAPDAAIESDIDAALAELDMERVAHRETRRELEKIKTEMSRIMNSPTHSSAPPPPPGNGKKSQDPSDTNRPSKVPASEQGNAHRKPTKR